MNTIQIFQNDQFGQIRATIGESNDTLFCLSDLCRVLGIANPRNVKNRLDEGDVREMDTPTTSGIQQMTYVNESGLYTTILRSNSQMAKPFQRWVTSDVLPAIRRTGGYMIAKPEETPEQIMARALVVAQDTIDRAKKENERLAMQNDLHKQQLQESAPKIQYYNEILDSSGFMTVNKIALDMGMSAVRLNRILVEKKVQYKEGDAYVLYAKYRDCGYTTMRPHPYIDSLGRTQTRQHLYWTEKGKQFILSLLNPN